MDDEWEDYYNRMVTELINEGLRCPECNSKPKKVEPIIYGQAAQAVCEKGHSFMVERNGD